MCTAHSLGTDAFQVVLPTDRPLPSKSLASSWREANLIVYMSSWALHYRLGIRAALDAGTRVLCAMQRIHVIHRLKADPEVRRRARAGAKLLHDAKINLEH
jgi:putative ubiquitin-RnfH superfamily antitoxin RatB of RatAB toxin-antitoxin module